MGTFGDIPDLWGHLGHPGYGDIRGHLGTFRDIWGHPGYGDIWGHLGTFGDIRDMWTFGDIQDMGTFGDI